MDYIKSFVLYPFTTGQNYYPLNDSSDNIDKEFVVDSRFLVDEAESTYGRDNKKDSLSDKIYSVTNLLVPDALLNLFGYYSKDKQYKLCLTCKRDEPDVIIFNCVHKYICKKCFELNSPRKCLLCKQDIKHYIYVKADKQSLPKLYSYVL